MFAALPCLPCPKRCNNLRSIHADSFCPDPDIIPIEAPLNANVWKVQVKQGDTISANQVVIILEAMKLEIEVHAEAEVEGGVVDKLLVKPNDVVEAGKPIVLVRKPAKGKGSSA